MAFRQGLAAQGVSAAGEAKARNGACASSRIQGGYAPDFASAQRLSRIALLSALALILSYVETMIPLPTVLPGVKLGLANVAVVVALFCFDTKTAAAVSVVKVLAAGFLFGSPVMLAYSLGGTVLAFASAALLAKVPGISVVVVSMASAILHNMGQIAVACFMLGHARHPDKPAAFGCCRMCHRRTYRLRCCQCCAGLRSRGNGSLRRIAQRIR